MPRKKETPILGKEEKVQHEIARLNDIFSEIDANMLQVLSPLIRNSAYITIVIDELHGIINETGYVDKYDNGGGQKGIKESVYVKMHKDYSKLQKDNLRCLAEYVPAAKKKTTLLAALKDS